MIVRQKQPAPQQITPNMTQRKLHLRPNLAAAGSVVQTQKLLAARVVIEDAMVVFVRAGRKTLRWPQGELVVKAGQAAAVAGGQTFDIVNEPDTQSGVFHAEWIAFDEAVPLQFAEHYGNAAALGNAVLLQGFPGLQAAFDYALATLVEPSSPELVVQAALHGVLACLHCGHIALTAVGRNVRLVHRLRRAIAAHPAEAWTAERAAAQQYVSTATLRRHLAEEGLSFRSLLVDVRMMRALTLLQVSDWPVARIAEEVGYESASRFTARFRQRFGFLPTAVRGQKKTAVGNRCSGTYRGMPQHLIQGGKQNRDG